MYEFYERLEFCHEFNLEHATREMYFYPCVIYKCLRIIYIHPYSDNSTKVGELLNLFKMKYKELFNKNLQEYEYQSVILEQESKTRNLAVTKYNEIDILPFE